jgi:hypothetical protein
MKDTISDATLYLNDTSGEKRKDIAVSPIAKQAVAKAPPNLAIYDSQGNMHEVVDHVFKLARDAKLSYENQRQAMKEAWTRADEYYWMAQKEHRMPELTRAKVSASVFYRCSRRLSDGAYLATFQQGEQPMKFFPELSVFDLSEDKSKTAAVTEALNRWAATSMRKTRFKEKMKKAYHQVYKYANVIAYVPYDYAIEKRKRYEPIDVNESVVDPVTGELKYVHKETGEESVTPFGPELQVVEYDHACKDEVGFHVLPIEHCYLDNRIEDLDRQTSFLWRSDMTRPEIWAEARAGKFKNVDKITALQQFQIFGIESDVTTQRIYDSGKTMIDALASEIYERWQCWVLLPEITVKTNKKGEVTDLVWDQNAAERRYVMEFIGPLSSGMPICVNFRESPYWGNGIPFIPAHSHEDDSGFYHRGLVNLLEDNMVQEQVAKGQMLDSRTLMNFRPMVRKIGAVKNKDMKITHNTVFDVVSLDAIKQMEVGDLGPSNKFIADYLKEDSEAISQTPSFFLGQAMGGRTSATEFSTIRDQSAAPAILDIKSLNMQLIGGYMRKLREYAPQFIDRDVAVPGLFKGISATVSPDEFQRDFRIEDIAVTDFENRMMVRQQLLNIIQVVATAPMFMGAVNPIGLLMKLFSQYREIFPNPEELLAKNPQVQAMLVEFQKQQATVQQMMQQPMEVEEPEEPEAPGDIEEPEEGAPPPGLEQQTPLEGNAQALPMMALGGQLKGM